MLREAEGEMRRILSDAAKAGDYNSVVKLASWARQLTEMMGEPPLALHSRGALTAPSRTTSAVGRSAVLKAKSPRGQRSSYPTFHRQNDRLVRVAWSKREKKEYEHKTPRAALEVVATAVAELGSDGRIFTMEEVLPVADSEGVEIPSYQAYVALSFLRNAGLVEQHGRQGYSIPRATELKTDLESLWLDLPKRAKRGDER